MCEESNRVMVKNELWNKIQSRRKAKGLDELTLNEDHVQNRETKLSCEDIERINTRKERNRMAAQRSRERKRQRSDALQKRVEELTEEQQELEKEVSTLTAQREQLQFMASHHNCKLRLDLQIQ